MCHKAPANPDSIPRCIGVDGVRTELEVGPNSMKITEVISEVFEW